MIDKRFIPFVIGMLLYLFFIRGVNYFDLRYLPTLNLIFLGLGLLTVGVSGLALSEWIMTFFLKIKVRKLLQKDERIIFAKKVFFHLRTPGKKFFHNPIDPFEGLSTADGLVSSAGLFFTSKGRIILLGNRTRNNFLTSPYTITLLNLAKDQIKKVAIEDADINTGGLPSKGIVLKILTGDNKEYALGIGGIGLSKIFNVTRIYTFEQQRQSIRKPVINFFKDKIA